MLHQIGIIEMCLMW